MSVVTVDGLNGTLHILNENGREDREEFSVENNGPAPMAKRITDLLLAGRAAFEFVSLGPLFRHVTEEDFFSEFKQPKPAV